MMFDKYVFVTRQGEEYVCRPDKDGFRCGNCHRGLLEEEIKKGDQCRVCGAVVTEILTSKDIVTDLDLAREENLRLFNERIKPWLDEIIAELDRATEKFGKFASRHEGIAIIDEEFQELKKAVYWNDGDWKEEAIQTAAMCLRLLVDCSSGPK